jgi:hypothetical protein
MAKFELEAEFSEIDLETILDALDGWETDNSHLLMMIDKLEQMGEPPADMDDDYKNGFGAFRQSLLSQKEAAKKNKKVRREKATLLKAKIIQKQHGDFNGADLETILDALDGWEAESMSLLQMVEKMKQMGEPPDDMDEDYRKHCIQFRNHIISQEDKARKDKKVIREKSTLLKAKVILLQQQRGIDELFAQADATEK